MDSHYGWKDYRLENLGPLVQYTSDNLQSDRASSKEKEKNIKSAYKAKGQSKIYEVSSFPPDGREAILLYSRNCLKYTEMVHLCYYQRNNY